MRRRTGAGKTGHSEAAALQEPVRFCLSRAARLAPADYREVFAHGRSQAGRYVVVWFREREGQSQRLGVVTSKRTLRLAVARSRARRLMREAFRLNRGLLREGVDMVLIARARIVNAGGNEVAADFRAVCRKAKLMAGRERA